MSDRWPDSTPGSTPDSRPDSRPDSPLLPAQDDAVRALLASARHTDPTPPDVVARLDTALASLHRERESAPDRPEEQAPVVTLASRRRRTAANLVLAAAAVVVVGIGVVQVLPSVNNSGGDSGSESSATSAESPEDLVTGQSDRAFGGSSESSAEADEKQGRAGEPSAQESAPDANTLSALDALTSASPLKAQVRALRSNGNALPSADTDCALPDVGAGRRVSVTYNGAPGVLVFRAPVGSAQQVDVFLCGESDAVRSVRLRVLPPR